MSHHLSIALTLPFLGTAGTTPALLHPLFVVATPFLNLLPTTEAPAVAMSLPTEEVATGGVGIDRILLVVGAPLRRSIAAEEANYLMVTVPGRTEFTSQARVTIVWRRSFLATPTTLPSNTLASTLKSMTISLSKLPVLEFQIPLPLFRAPRLTLFSWRISPTLVTTPPLPSKSIRSLLWPLVEI